MTRIDYSDGCDRHCGRSDHAQMQVVNHLRDTAHKKHGERSVENGDGIYTGDRLCTILTEEVGEVADVLNEFALDNITENNASVMLAKELYDVMVVASAWLDALREEHGLAVPSRMANGTIKFSRVRD